MPRPLLSSTCLAPLLLAAALTTSPVWAIERRIEPRVPTEQEAPIVLLVDLSSGQTLFARESDRRFVPASITKAMTTFLAFEKMERGELFPHQVVTVSEATFRQWRGKGSTMFLNRGDRVTVGQLLHGVTTVSANDASVVLGESASGSLAKWLDEMNSAARRIGMNDSHFGSPNGFPDEGQTWTTARDLATLAKAMLRRHPQKYREYVGHAEYSYGGITQPNHDPLIGKFPGADGIKTGFTYQAGYGYLGTAQRNGRRLVMVVAGSDSGRERNRAAQALMEWGFAAFEQHPLFQSADIVGQADVQNGSALSVGLMPPHAIAVSSARGHSPQIGIYIEYEGPLRAPISKGEEVASLRITVDGVEGSSIPLMAAQDVSEASLPLRLLNGVASWFR